MKPTTMTPELLAEVILDVDRKAASLNDVSLKSNALCDIIKKCLADKGLPETFFYPLDLAFYWDDDVVAWAEHLKAHGNLDGFFDEIVDDDVDDEL